ncbi:MAG: archaetidylserine decarboxylase [Gammaproteobacteria bacterium]
MTERLFVALQYILPKRLIGRVVYHATRSRVGWFKNALIRAFVRAFDVDTAEMDRPDARDYPSFNAFFTRALAPGARPIDQDPAAVCCPADGRLQQCGRIEEGQLFQAKGISYRLDTLLGVDRSEVAHFDGGRFMTIYLAPYNYHRVHAPTPGNVRRMNFIPGELFSVNQATAGRIRGLFARNERVACEIVDGPFDYWLVFVGAFNVASVSTAWAGEIAPTDDLLSTNYTSADRHALATGDYCGHFNMGSTVILAYPPNAVEWDPGLAAGDTLRVGRRVGRL